MWGLIPELKYPDLRMVRREGSSWWGKGKAIVRRYREGPRITSIFVFGGDSVDWKGNGKRGVSNAKDMQRMGIF